VCVKGWVSTMLTKAATRHPEQPCTLAFDGPLNIPETCWCDGRGGGPQHVEPSMPALERDLTLAEVAELRRFTPRYLPRIGPPARDPGLGLGKVDPL
jgi:hypothetical protein